MDTNGHEQRRNADGRRGVLAGRVIGMLSGAKSLRTLKYVTIPFIITVLVVASVGDALSQTTPPLGTAESFGVLGGQAVSNVGATVVNGNLGVSPGTAVTGFPPGIVTGTTYTGNNGVVLQAQSDLTTAYNVLAGLPCDFTLTGQDLGGLTLIPGVYCFASSAQLTGILTLNLQNETDPVFVFQIGSTLTTATDSSVLFINGDPSCNVFWQVGSSATLGTSTDFVGNIVALTDATLVTGTTVDGRVLARNGEVTLGTNVITPRNCATLAVFLSSFTAEPDLDAIRVEWETVSELTNTGFNLYRGTSADGDDREQLAFVPSQGPGSNQGFSYRYDDTDVEMGQTYWYWLEDIDLNGVTTLHGPVDATINAPTAVALTSLDASAVAAPAFPIATIGLVGFTVLGLWWRKRGRTLAS